MKSGIWKGKIFMEIKQMVEYRGLITDSSGVKEFRGTEFPGKNSLLSHEGTDKDRSHVAVNRRNRLRDCLASATDGTMAEEWESKGVLKVKRRGTANRMGTHGGLVSRAETKE